MANLKDMFATIMSEEPEQREIEEQVIEQMEEFGINKKYKIKAKVTLTPQHIFKALRLLAFEGIDTDEVTTVLQAMGYILLDEELFPEDDEDED